MKKFKSIWRRTGITRDEFSHNKQGVITYAQEKNQKGWTREVQVEYKTVELKDS